MDNEPKSTKQYSRYYHAIEGIAQKPRTRIYSTAIFSFLVVSLFGWYAIRPTLETILFLRREIADKTSVNKKMEDKITTLIEAQATYQDIEKDLPAVDEALPTSTQVIELVSRLDHLAQKSGVQLSAVQVPAVPLINSEASLPGTLVQNQVSRLARAADKKLGDFTLALVVVGPYSNIQSFLEGTLTMRRIVTIDDLALAQGKEESSSSSGSLIRLSLKLKGYHVSK